MDRSPAPLLERIARRAREVGLEPRGACHVDPAFVPALGLAGRATVVLLGFVGGASWPRFAASAEAGDGRSHPLDRWSERVIGGLAQEFAARPCFPSGTPTLPFQRLAQRAEALHPSPIGLLIHPDHGLWHAYRGALLLDTVEPLPPAEARASPCSGCAAPCLAGCPVQAFDGERFDVARCVGHLRSPAGRVCLEEGCRARAACPVAPGARYGTEQVRFHMRAFLAALS